jgi:hypothetical protein
MIGYAVFSIAWAIGMLIVQLALPGRSVPPEAVAMHAVMLGINLLLACALPIAILIVMTRPHVRRAFATGGVAWYAAYPQGWMPSGGNDLQTP